MSDTMSVPEAAAVLRVSERTIWRWLGSGRLASERVGGRVLITPPAEQQGHAISEAKAAHGAAAAASPQEPEPGPWPFTVENLARQKAMLAIRRRRAADEMDRLAHEIRPDPDGLTGVDYIRELRGPIGDEIDAEHARSDP